jgi:hypothetical protein
MGEGKIVGLILGTCFAVAIIYMMIRLYVASRENAKKQFLHELTYGDIAFIPFEGVIGEVPAATRNAGGGRSSAATGVARGTSLTHSDTGL